MKYQGIFEQRTHKVKPPRKHLGYQFLECIVVPGIFTLAATLNGCDTLALKNTKTVPHQPSFLELNSLEEAQSGKINHVQEYMQVNSSPYPEHNIPQLVSIAPAIPAPSQITLEPTHTIIVSDVPVKELLFSLARDSELNIDIDSNVTGNITINAVDQPLNALLDRITENSGLIYDYKNEVLRIRVDNPFLKNYRVDYINMTRSSQSETSVSTQIGAAGASEDSSGGSANDSSTSITNTNQNAFWDTLRQNLTAIVAPSIPKTNSSDDNESTDNQESSASDTAKSSDNSQTDASAVNSNIIINQEAGILSVRANQKQHKEVENFLNELQYSSRRQVLIEATIAEVTLNNSFQAGIDWNYIDNQLSISPASIGQLVTDIPLFDRPYFKLDYTNNENGDSIQTTLSALETFGDVRIVSSPKVMAINNQTALLKVVDNIIYFDLDVTVESSEDSDPIVTFDTTARSLPVGFVMSVTPFINDHEIVTLSVRPTISRIIGYTRDPNPALAEAGVISEIPIVQVREVESVLKVGSKDIAVMGGLMQNETNDQDRGTPFLSRVPWLGSLFKYQDNQAKKSELVIFIRPSVIDNASLNADLENFKHYLPEVN